VSKTQLIQFSASYQNTNLSTFNLNSNRISSQNSIEYLGIKIDSHLNWQDHIENLSKRLTSATFVLRIIRESTNLETQITVYHAYFASIMNYGLTVWGSANQAKKIFILQKRAVRLIAKVPQITHCKEFFIRFKIMTLYSSYIYQLALMVKRDFDTFMENQISHDYNTRSRNLIKPVQHRLNIFHLSPQYMAPKIYNSLPLTIKNINSITKFKKTLKNFLLDKAYYSVEEYLEGK